MPRCEDRRVYVVTVLRAKMKRGLDFAGHHLYEMCMSAFPGSRFIRVYVIPGAVYQSLMVGGGYGTGREIVEYFTRFGLFGGTEAGAGLLQGINERIDAALIEKRGTGLGGVSHALIAVAAVSVSALVSLWGITNLIAKAYGTMAWVFFAIYIVPLVTIGLWKILHDGEGDVST